LDEPERENPPMEGTNFPRDWEGEGKKAASQKRQLLKLAKSRGAEKNKEAADSSVHNGGVWF